jgi:choline dehydrogenase-like flavoprotein
LVEQVLGAAGPFLKYCEAGSALLRKIDLIQIFSLETNCSDRRPQFMSCVSDKTSLLIQHHLDPLEQAIDRRDKRVQLAGHRLNRKLLQVVGAPVIEECSVPRGSTDDRLLWSLQDGPTGDDRATMIASVRMAMDIFRQPALMKSLRAPFTIPASDAEADIVAFIEQKMGTNYHPTSSCAIGRIAKNPP